MTPHALKHFIEMYESLSKDNLQQIRDVYSDEVLFKDALHEVNGIDDLEAYFEALYTNLLYCKFEITDVQSGEGNAYVRWEMQYAHSQLAGKKNIKVDGVSHLKFEDKITYHRDYIDMGQMLYEHIPVLGAAIRFIKKRAVS